MKPAGQQNLPLGGTELVGAKAAHKFILGGNAHVTLVSKVSGTRYTYRIRSSDDGRVSFVGLLTGPENTSAYTFFGTIFNGDRFQHSWKARLSPNSPGAKAFSWAFRHIAAGVVPDSLEIHHEGRCGRCGRLLTVPESVTSGFGPECTKKGKR